MENIMGDPDYMEELQGMPMNEALMSVHMRMGENAPTMAIIAAALTESGVQLSGFDVDMGAAKRAEDLKRTAVSRLDELMGGGTGFLGRFTQRAFEGFFAGGGRAGAEAVAGLRASQDILGAAGTSEESRLNAASHALVLLNSKGDDFRKAVRALGSQFTPDVSKKILNQISAVRGDDTQRELVSRHLQRIVEPLMSSSAGAAMFQSGKQLSQENIKRLYEAIDNVTISTGVKGDDLKKLATGTPEQQTTVAVLEEIRASIAEQRRYNTALLGFIEGRSLPSNPETMRRATGQGR